jgi:hypothetical protein
MTTMKLGPGIRIGLVAVTLLAQFALPVAHDPRIVTSDHPVLASLSVDSSASGSQHALGGHDPSVCPVCFALSQARSGLGCTLSDPFLRLTPAASAQPIEPASALPRTPELAAAPPRAPPVPALVFA